MNTVAAHIVLKSMGLGDDFTQTIPVLVKYGFFPRPSEYGADPALWRFDRHELQKKLGAGFSKRIQTIALERIKFVASFERDHPRPAPFLGW